MNMKRTKEEWSMIFKDIVDRKAFNEASRMFNKSLYNSVIWYKDRIKYAEIIYNNMTRHRKTKQKYDLEHIVETKDWDKARVGNNKSLYHYVFIHRKDNKYAKEIWNHISSGTSIAPNITSHKRGEYDKIYKDIITNQNWDKAKRINNATLYDRVAKSRKTNPLAKIIWDNICTGRQGRHRDKKQKEVYNKLLKEIIDTKDWNLAKQDKNQRLYTYIYYNKDTNEYAKTVWDQISVGKATMNWWKNKLHLYLEDLVLLDKTQLLQIAFLKKLPKDIYKEIVECPKGEERKKLIESIPDMLEDIKENQETFEDSLEEAVDAKITTQSEEEKKFKEDLKTGIDLAEKIGHVNPEERIKEIFSEINALGNMDEGDYDGPEAIDFLVSSEIQKLWNVVIRTSSHDEMQKLIEEYMLKKNSSKFFNRVTSIFLKQYQDVMEFVIPKGYSFPYEPLMMQKLTALMVSERRQFANWSETGSGKTISGVLTSRYIDSKITLIFAVNSTVSNWTENAIRQAYPDSKVYTKNHISENTKLDTNFYNYIVVNYEEFQNPDKYVNKWKPFLTNNKVDLVILDEIQKVKVKTTGTESIRRRIIENMLQDIDLRHGRDLQKEGRVVPVLALSATPVINSLNEVLSLLSLLRGVEFSPVTRTTRKSALGCHFELTKCGIRLAEESPATERLITFPIKRKFEDLSEISGKNILNRIDTSACTMKIGECIRKGYLVKGTKTIIYTDLITNVIDIIVSYLQLRGFKVGEFTGRNGILRDSVMQDFIGGDTDILLASKPISTGVDGLQKICNRIIVLIPAWTYAEYHQLIGRINRKGTTFNEVDIIIPTVEFVKDNGDSWSLDNERLTRIRFKKALADVTVNGNIPDEIITDEQALKLAKNSLSEFLKNKTTDKNTSETPVIATEIKPTGKPRVRGNRDRRDYWSELQDFNQLISASTTEHIFAENGVIKSKEDWLKYHELRDNSIGEIKDQPIYTIARDFIKSGKPKVLGDMGCGMNRLKTLLPDNYKVISVDWYAVDETVKVCNLQDTSSIISDCELDIAVYSLAFWGKDWRNVLKDAYRILDYDGKIIIAQPIRSESKSIEKVEKALAEHGFENIRIVKDAIGKYYYMIANK